MSQIRVWHDSMKGWRIFIPGDGNSRLPLEAVEQIQAQKTEQIVKLIEEHWLTGKSVAGFLKLCICGEGVDMYQEHIIDLIRAENSLQNAQSDENRDVTQDKESKKYGADCERESHTKWERFRCELSLYWYEFRSGMKLHLLLKEIYGRLTRHYCGGNTHQRIFSFDKDKK